MISAVVNAFKGIATQMHVRYGSYDADEKHSLVCACNGRFYGGGFNPAPTATLDGESLRARSVEMKLLPRALKLIVPKGLGKGTEIPPLTL